jgi:TRAP-type transport system small permease protein
MSLGMARLSEWYGRLLDGLVFVACLLLLVMTVMIGADVVSRNVGGGGVAVSNELSEDILYLMTLLVAPWLLRQGQHIRVDIVLRALPVRVAWALEWAGDIVGFLCCIYFVWYGLVITRASYSAGSINIKTLVTPEWWTLAPLPLGFALLGIEFIFRMYRLSTTEIGLRDDAVSAA